MIFKMILSFLQIGVLLSFSLLKFNNGKYEFFVYEDVELIDYEGSNINPNIIKTLENNTFLMTVNGEVFQLIDK